MFAGKCHVLERFLQWSLIDALNVSPEMKQQTHSDFYLLCPANYYCQ